MNKSWQVVTTDSTDPKYELLKDAIIQISGRKNNCTVSIWNSIAAALQQTHLDHKHTVIEILSLSYQLGITALKNGETIDNPIAWLRLTSIRVIRNLSHSHT